MWLLQELTTISSSVTFKWNLPTAANVDLAVHVHSRACCRMPRAARCRPANGHPFH